MVGRHCSNSISLESSMKTRFDRLLCWRSASLSSQSISSAVLSVRLILISGCLSIIPPFGTIPTQKGITFPISVKAQKKGRISPALGCWVVRLFFRPVGSPSLPGSGGPDRHGKPEGGQGPLGEPVLDRKVQCSPGNGPGYQLTA